MNLLSVKDSRTKRAAENSTQELRSVELDVLIRDKRKELDDLVLLIAGNLERCRTENEVERREHIELLTPLRREVEELEQRKKQALLPLHEKEKEVEDRMVVLLQREEEVSIRESEAESTLEHLQDRLDDIQERSHELDSKKNALDKREFGVKIQEDEVIDRSTKLTTVLETGYESLKKAASLVEKEKAEARGREIILSERESRLVKKEKDLESREKALIDKYQTLERSIARLNKS